MQYLCTAFNHKDNAHRFSRLFLSSPVCQPYLYVDRQIDNAREPMFAMELLSTSLSTLRREAGGTFKDKAPVVFFVNIVRVVYFLGECNIQHNDLHMGNLGLLFLNDEGEWQGICRSLFTTVESIYYHLKLIDFGLAEMMGTEGSKWRTHGRTGSPIFTAPLGWHHNDWWSVLFLGFVLSGFELPWYKYDSSLDTINKIKVEALCGRNWAMSLPALLELKARKSPWYDIAKIHYDKKEIAPRIQLFQLDLLFGMLIDGEIEYLQTGSQRAWHKATCQSFLRKCGQVKDQ